MSMATTPEEFFIKDLMEQPPLSPPVFLELPHKPNASNEDRHQVPNNDMTLPYISRMLMEDDDDELGDHPALLQVQQSFAKILSSPPLVGTNTNNSEGPNDFLHEDVRKMRSDVFIQSVVNQSYGSSFLSRFREILFYYMAMFDMLDTTLPRESESRLVFEKLVLGCYAFNGISCEGSDLVLRPKKYRQWQARNERAGLF
ncbi:hypothetical protein ZEAMMB73_Zm00001d026108 [Zea mays]|uniref:Uncharacterized protein n=1 Tax=Zea mays TaxID=4577 RepID=A0A1D6JCC1_MAIZE|nr:hypothetical protein ZEAMMB73_Zm00001d026108 [Zea mays]